MDKRTNKAKEVKVAYDKTFTSEYGEKVLFDLMNVCNFTGSTVLDAQSYEPIAMAFRDGQKSIVARIINQLNIDNEQFIKMLEQKQSQEGDIFED